MKYLFKMIHLSTIVENNCFLYFIIFPNVSQIENHATKFFEFSARKF